MNDFELDTAFLADAEASALLESILAEASWQEEHLRMFGREVRMPRQVCWYGDTGVGYRYSGIDHYAQGWLRPLEVLREKLVFRLGQPFNFVLLNYYADQRDSMSWHADNEPELGVEPTIASISLGAERTFRIRPTKAVAGQRRVSSKLPLTHGSLLVMRGRSQVDYQHALPKVSTPCGRRLNLTFRQVNNRASHLQSASGA